MLIIKTKKKTIQTSPHLIIQVIILKIILKWVKKYENVNNNYDENYIDIKGNELYQSTVLPNSTQRRYHKNYLRWGSNKKFKIKNGNSTKESFFPI